MVKAAFPEAYYDRLTVSIGRYVGLGAFGMGISAKLV